MPPWQRLILLHFTPSDTPLVPDFIAEATHSRSEERILVALEIVLTQQRLLLARVPADLGEASNPEIRIKFFRALPFLDVEGDVTEVLRRCLQDPDWRARAMAARACAHFRPAVLTDRLLEMCRTFENPAEAFHAGRALAALGGEGWFRLQDVATSPSGIARHIATETVERHMLGGAA